MRCHVMSCHVMSCHVMSCDATPLYVITWYDNVCLLYGMTWHDLVYMTCCVVVLHVMLWCGVSWCVALWCVVWFYDMQCYTMETSCMYIHVYMYMCIYIYIYIYICIHVHIHIYTHNYHGMVYVLNVWIVHSCTNHTVPCHRMLYGIAYSISHQIVLNYHVSSHGACIELFIMRVCES